MLRAFLLVSGLVVGGAAVGLADTIQLKDKAAIVGKILAEKRDQIAVDIGYTVLVIPRKEVAKISKSDSEAGAKPAVAPKKTAASETAAAAQAKAGFYSTPTK